MTRKMHKGDATPEPDSIDDERFLSDVWPSDNGASIELTIVAASWDTSLIDDLKARGPAMLDLIATRLSLDPQRVSLLLCNDEDTVSYTHLRAHRDAHESRMPSSA